MRETETRTRTKIHRYRYDLITILEYAGKQYLKVQVCPPKAGISTTCKRPVSLKFNGFSWDSALKGECSTSAT